MIQLPWSRSMPETASTGRPSNAARCSRACSAASSADKPLRDDDRVREGWVPSLALDLPSVAPPCARRERLPPLWPAALVLPEVLAVERRRLGAADELVLLLPVSATVSHLAPRCSASRPH